jgi:hypothetical protein
MNHPITDLVKWAAKTAQAVQKICLTRQGPCVGICLLFLEMDDKGEKKWYFTTHMAGDGEEGMDNPERKKLERAMEMGAKAMQMAYDDVDEGYDVTTINELSGGSIH